MARNSQLHAVNQAGEGAEPASAKLFRSIDGRVAPLLTFIQPNANLQEHYIFFEYLRHHVDIDVLLLPVVFDDLRETGIRIGLTKALQDPVSNTAISATEVGLNILNANQDMARPDAKEPELNGSRSTFQESSEEVLNGWLEQRSALWAARAEIRGQIMNGLYQFRNRFFCITSQSKRKQIPGRYSLNMKALETLLRVAQAEVIPVVIYIVPVRNDVQTPYVESEYVDFKKQVAILAGETEAIFVNLEGLVPGDLWGSTSDAQGKGEGLDFMHFQEAGHELLAKALEGKLLELVRSGKITTQ